MRRIKFVLSSVISRIRETVNSFIALTIVAFIVSITCRSSFPVGDPAVFEYIGRGLNDGAHLYTDLWDNKLPSIYLVNALWWRLFGSNYELHLIAESLINASTIVLFGAILHRSGVQRWQFAVSAFSVLFLFIGGPFNQTEHYAVPMMFAGILLSLRDRNTLAGVFLVLASTFWLPAILIALVPLLYTARPRTRLPLLASVTVTTLLYTFVIVLLYGTQTIGELLHSWFSYELAHFDRANVQEAHHYPVPFLSPRYYIQSGLGILFGLIAASWNSATTQVRKFALSWAGAGLVIVFGLGKPSLHYFLPLYAPLIMLLAEQSLSYHIFRRRWYFSGIAAISASVMIYAAVKDAQMSFFGTRAAIEYTGDVVRENFGRRAVGVLPWEIYLSADARPPGRFFLASGNVQFARTRDRWIQHPVVFVDAADLRYNGKPPPSDLQVMCTSQLMMPYILRSSRAIPGLRCVRT